MAKLSMNGAHPHIHFHANEFHMVTRVLSEARTSPLQVVNNDGHLRLEYGGTHTAVVLPDFHVVLPIDPANFPVGDDAYVTLRRRDDGIMMDLSSAPISEGARAVLDASDDFLGGKRPPMRRTMPLAAPAAIQQAAPMQAFRSRRASRAFGES
jgi:hypothetical protein